MLKQQRIRKSMTSVMLSQILNYGVMLIQTPYLTRHLLPESFGVYSFANTLLLISMYLIGYAANNSATFLFRKYATNRLKRSQAFWNQVSVQLILAAGLIAAILLWVSVSDEMRQDAPVYLLLTVYFLFTALYCPWVLSALEKFNALSTAATGARVASLILMLMFVRTPDDLPWAVGAVILPNVVITVIFYAWIIRSGTIALLPPSRWQPLKVFRRDFFIAMTVYAVTSYTYIGMVLGKFVMGGHDYGLLAFADRFRWIMQVIVPTFGAVLFSRYCGERAISAARGAAFGRKSALLLLGFGTATGIGLAILVKPAIWILGGAEFLPSQPLVLIAAAMMPLIALNYYLTFFVINVFKLGKQQIIAIGIAAAAVTAALLLKRHPSPIYVIAVIGLGELARTVTTWAIIHFSGMHVFRPGLDRASLRKAA